MATEHLFREDSYLQDCEATIVARDENGGLVLDRTVFYATSGGQPGDGGLIRTPSGAAVVIATARYGDAAKTEIVHIPADAAAADITVGTPVRSAINWPLRYARMRMHTALHLLSAILPYPVTGGAIGDHEGRLDFDIPDAGLDKDEISARLADMVAADAAVRTRWISDDELLANLGLVKTMAVKPPIGSGRVRLVEIVGYDLQPCGGTHVRSTAEIGPLRITQIEKKGRQNRRVRIAFC